MRPSRSQNALERSIVSFMIDEYAMRTTVSTISSTTEPSAFLMSSSRTGSCAILFLPLADLRQHGDIPELFECDHAIPRRERVAGLPDFPQHFAPGLARRHQGVDIETRGLEAHRLELGRRQQRHHAARRMVV